MTRCDLLRAACLLWLGLGLVLGGIHWWTVLPPIIAYVLFAIDGVARAGSGWLMPVIRHGDRKGDKVALTFDDGPDAGVTPRILDILRSHGARATFFVIGRHAEAHPDLIERILAEGHELGNHSHGHSRLLNLSTGRTMRNEIERGMATLNNWPQASASTRLYRPPMGLKNPSLARIQRHLGLRVVAWSLHAGDTRKRDANAIAGRILDRIRPGDIVLFHDGHDLPHRKRSMAVAEALGMILPELQRRGLETVTVSELLNDGPSGLADKAADAARVQAGQESRA
jgi:peptidoglycan-N-acetylglucosamine deacetylase